MGLQLHMTSKADTPGPTRKLDRKARLAEALRNNLQRRKAQARSRRTGGADERPEGLGGGGKGPAGTAGNDNEPPENKGKT
jgi:hypothetical protein